MCCIRIQKRIIDKRKYIEAKIWDTDGSDAIRSQSLIYGIFFCNLEMKSDKKRSKCNANEQILNYSFAMKLPSLLLVNTVRSPGDHLEKVIRTATDVHHVLRLSYYLIAD